MMKEILIEWRKFLKEAEGAALDLPSTEGSGHSTTIPSLYFGESTNQNIQLYPQINLSNQDKINLYNFVMAAPAEFYDRGYFDSITDLLKDPLQLFQHYPKGYAAFGETREEIFRNVLKHAIKVLINPIVNNYPQVKNRALSQHTSEQSLQAYTKLIKKKNYMSFSAKEEEEYRKSYPNQFEFGKKLQDKLIQSIPAIVKKNIEETKVYLSFDKEQNKTALGWAIGKEHSIVMSADMLWYHAYPNPEQIDPRIFTTDKISKDVIEVLTHELGHIIDHRMGSYLVAGEYKQNYSEMQTAPLSGILNARESAKSFLKSPDKDSTYVLSSSELYTRLKKLLISLSPKTGIITPQMLKDFLNNKDPNKFKDAPDSEPIFDRLDLSTDEKINKFVNFMNSLAKANIPQSSQVA